MLRQGAANQTSFLWPCLGLASVLLLSAPLCAADSSHAGLMPTRDLSISVGGGPLPAAGAAADHEHVRDQQDGHVSFKERRAVGRAGLGWFWGFDADAFRFSRAAAYPVDLLQSYAFTTGVEWRQNGDQAASITLSPGLYFARHARLRDWDVPIDAVAGIPLRGAVSGVLGISYARFYRHPIPVLGLAWHGGSRLTIDAVYPEPAIGYRITERWTAYAAGHLVGGGYRLDDGDERVEYFGYRVAPGVRHQLTSRIELSAEAGAEVERTFDLHDRQRKIRGPVSAYASVMVQEHW